MVCGATEYDLDDAAHTTITNPVLIVEVLSVTTEKGDRGNKWLHYLPRNRQAHELQRCDIGCRHGQIRSAEPRIRPGVLR